MPQRQHYIPRFHLSKWLNSDGFLTRYRVIRGEIDIDHKASPASVCSDFDLWSLRAEDEEISRALENSIFSRMDDRASDIFHRLLSASSIDDRDAIDLGWYMVSILKRDPNAVLALRRYNGLAETLRNFALAKFNMSRDAFNDKFTQHYGFHSDDADLYFGYVASLDGRLESLLQNLNLKDFSTHVVRSPLAESLLLSNRPVIPVRWGRNDHDTIGYIMPVTPSLLAMISEKKWTPIIQTYLEATPHCTPFEFCNSTQLREAWDVISPSLEMDSYIVENIKKSPPCFLPSQIKSKRGRRFSVSVNDNRWWEYSR